MAMKEATEWPKDISPWSSAMGREIPPIILSPVGTTEVIDNFELRILNLAGLCKLAHFVGVKQDHFGTGSNSQLKYKRAKAINCCLRSAKHSHRDSPGRSPGNRNLRAERFRKRR